MNNKDKFISKEGDQREIDRQRRETTMKVNVLMMICKRKQNKNNCDLIKSFYFTLKRKVSRIKTLISTKYFMIMNKFNLSIF